MTNMPVLDPHIMNELTTRATQLVAEVHTHMLAKRSVDHSVLEVLAVRESDISRPFSILFLLC